MELFYNGNKNNLNISKVLLYILYYFVLKYQLYVKNSVNLIPEICTH